MAARVWTKLIQFGSLSKTRGKPEPRTKWLMVISGDKDMIA